VARSIIEQGPLTEAQYISMCGPTDVCRLLLRRNIFAVNTDGLIGFNGKITEDAIREHLCSGFRWTVE
jgi:hypothetical protein